MATDITAAREITQPPAPAASSTDTTKAPLITRQRAFIAAGVLLVVAVAGFFGWRMLSPREGTDDAQVTGHVSPVATRVGGTVVAIKVRDNESVKAGTVLVELDPRDYQLAVAKAEADLAVTEAAFRAATSDVPVTSSSARSGEQVARVGVRRPVENLGHRALLDDLALGHHADTIGHLAHDAEVVGDEQHRHVEPALQLGK